MLFEIWNLEDSLSVSHVLQIRKGLEAGGQDDPRVYLATLRAAKRASDAAIASFKKSA